MAKKNEQQVEVDESVRESDADSEAYTEERKQAAQEHFEAMRENDRRQFEFLGVPEPEVEIPDPKDRPIDRDAMTEDERAALERQEEVASEGYKPKGFEDYNSETFESEDINPEAKEFQVREPDEYTGPEAAETAYQTGFNPRTVATSTNPDDLVRVGAESDETAEERVEEITGRDADSIREEQGGVADNEQVDEDKGSGADEVTPRRRKASKSSTDEEPNKVEK